MISSKNIFLLLSIVFTQILFAQNNAVIKASVNKNKILLGEPLIVKVEMNLPSGSSIEYSEPDSISHFEFLEKVVVDSTINDGEVNIIRTYTITSFDSGRWEIPPFVLTKSIMTDPIPIDVDFSDFDPEQDYHGIKDIQEVKTGKKKLPWWIYGIAAMLLGLITYIILRKKKQPVVLPVSKITVDPYDEAMQQLDDLQKEQITDQEYFSRLINIFRLYTYRKKGILSLQKTTDDLIVQIRNVLPDNEQFEKLTQALRLSDFVKFAKYIPSDEDRSSCFNKIKNTINAFERSGTEKLPDGEI